MTDTTDLLGSKKIMLASYAHVMNNEFTKLGGPALALRDFLKTGAAKLTCVWQPLPISETLDAIGEVFEQDAGKTYRFWVPNIPWGKEGDVTFLYVALKLRDILATWYFAFRLRDRYDYFVGVEALDALMGVLFRRLGLARKVIYYNLDYGQVRFKIKILNTIFHAMDRLAFQHCDAVWNLSPEMAKARTQRFAGAFQGAPQITVPIGTDFERVERLPFDRIEKHRIVYLGVLADKCGVPLVFDAMPAIMEMLPQTQLLIIGGGPLENELSAKAKESGLADRITFTGRVSDSEVERLLCACAVGIAPYLADADSTKKFTDVTKPRMYMTCGLPVVITDVPPIAKEIVENGAGVIIEYDSNDLAKAVVEMLCDEPRLKRLRENAIRLASKYSWSEIFSRAFAETMDVVDK